jgi:transcriptional repressor NrdR
VQLRELTVVKSTGEKRVFDRDKIARSMSIALRKRPVEADMVEMAINRIVQKLESEGESDIPTRRIGELVMAELKKLDAVAYIRYASVYRDFGSVDDFEKFVDKL